MDVGYTRNLLEPTRQNKVWITTIENGIESRKTIHNPKIPNLSFYPSLSSNDGPDYEAFVAPPPLLCSSPLDLCSSAPRLHPFVAPRLVAANRDSRPAQASPATSCSCHELQCTNVSCSAGHNLFTRCVSACQGEKLLLYFLKLMAKSLSSLLLRGVAGFPAARSSRIVCGTLNQSGARYFATVPNDPDTHDDFKPTNKLENSSISLADIVQQ
ncbi:hypothetical protein CRG98_008461, partial [Punica granatum]